MDEDKDLTDRFGSQTVTEDIDRPKSDGDVIYYEMPMYFWQGDRVRFFIHGWESTDGSSYGIGWLGTLIFGFLLEGLIVLRTYLAKSF